MMVEKEEIKRLCKQTMTKYYFAENDGFLFFLIIFKRFLFNGDIERLWKNIRNKIKG